MKEVLSWIVEHYDLIILVGACLLDIVLFLFGVFKKQKMPVKQAVIEKLPDMIRKAEEIYGSGHGEEKKIWVLKAAAAYYEKISKIPTSALSGHFMDIALAMEDILNTPQKKG